MLSSIFSRIVFPTLIFSMFNYFPKTIIRGEEVSLSTLLHDSIFGGSLWFTCALAVSELLLFLMLMSRKKRMTFYVVLSCLMTAIALVLAKSEVLINGDMNIPWYYKTGMIATLYLTIGGVFYKYERSLEKVLSTTLMVLISVAIVFALCLKYPIKTSINACSINLLGIVVSTTSVMVLIYLCKKIPSFKSIKWIGRHSLGLYFLSGGMPNIISVIWKHTDVEMNYVMFIVLAFLSYGIATFFVFALDRYIPFIFNTSSFHIKIKTNSTQ